jgi:hypothetical protein
MERFRLETSGLVDEFLKGGIDLAEYVAWTEMSLGRVMSGLTKEDKSGCVTCSVRAPQCHHRQ